jgi:predicted DNA-binding transcriptional regulator AlpA
MRKRETSRPYPPDFVSAETFAYRLDCSVRSIQDYVKSRLLPKPVQIGNLVRWRWSDIVQHLETQNDQHAMSPGSNPLVSDEYSADIRKARQSA